MNDRYHDLGIRFGGMVFTPEREAARIEAQFGRVIRATVARVTIPRALADVK